MPPAAQPPPGPAADGGETVAVPVSRTASITSRRWARPAARRSTAREAGLFHTAFLLPSRADLARWTHHAMADRVPAPPVQLTVHSMM